MEKTDLLFITLIKFRKSVKDVVNVVQHLFHLFPNVKIIENYWTLGDYDAVWIYEAPSDMKPIKLGIDIDDAIQTQTLVVIPSDDVQSLTFSKIDKIIHKNDLRKRIDDN